MKKKQTRFIKRGSCKTALFIFCFLGVSKLCHLATDGFAISHIHSDLSYDPRWDVPTLSPQEEAFFKNILGQRFFYLTKGAQCYVFISEDREYILKFFKFHHLSFPTWISSLPLPDFLKAQCLSKQRKKQKELEGDFASYKLAYDHLKEQTALIYLHLNKTSHLKKILHIQDKLLIEHPIDLDQCEFIIQKKADLVYPVLEKWIQQGEMQKSKRAIESLLTLLKTRAEKGIYDLDPNLSKNFGFIEGKAVQIDLGRFTSEKSLENQRREIFKLQNTKQDFKQWLGDRDPKLAAYFEQEFEKLWGAYF